MMTHDPEAPVFEPRPEDNVDADIVKKFNAWVHDSYAAMLEEAEQREKNFDGDDTYEGGLLSFRIFEGGYKMGLKE